LKRIELVDQFLLGVDTIGMVHEKSQQAELGSSQRMPRASVDADTLARLIQ
jgi:hypothetical protein